MPLPSDAPTWTDFVLFVMGVALVAGLVAGWVSHIPVRITGSVGSIVAAVALVGGMVLNPS